jgi:hypothetical protein
MPPTTSNQFHHATSLRKVKSTPSKTAIPFLLFLCATTALAFPHTTEADSYTKLLIHADGAEGSTTFTDSSPFHHAVTVTGSAEVDTAQSKFGGASVLFDGNRRERRLACVQYQLGKRR